MNCKLCNKKSEYLEAHHIIPKSRGGDNSDSNLIKICSECHGKAHDVSFSNDRGGLIKEGHARWRDKHEEAKNWLNEKDNDNLAHNKMMELREENEDKHMLMLLLLERGNFTIYDLMKWCKDGNVKVRTTITF